MEFLVLVGQYTFVGTHSVLELDLHIALHLVVTYSAGGWFIGSRTNGLLCSIS